MDDPQRVWEFIKMHGLGNDYLFVDALQGPLDALPSAAVIRDVCDRHRGFGADGVIALLPPGPGDPTGAALRMRIWNADGSEGEMCGNGLRCAVKLAYERGHVDRSRSSCRVATGAGPLEVWPVWQGDRVVACREEMGAPSLGGVVGEDGPWLDRPVTWQRPRAEASRTHLASAVSMGNPHLVLFVDEGADPPDVLVDGPVLEHSPLFPNRVNVGFARVLAPDRVVHAVWERGAGATQACGTGAAACLAAGVRTGRLGRRVEIALPGGVLLAEWPTAGGDGAEASIYLTGPAQTVGVCRYDPR